MKTKMGRIGAANIKANVEGESDETATVTRTVMVKPCFTPTRAPFPFEQYPHDQYVLIRSDWDEFTNEQGARLGKLARDLDTMLRSENLGCVNDFDHFESGQCMVSYVTKTNDDNDAGVLAFRILAHAHGVDRANWFCVNALTFKQYMALRFPDADDDFCEEDDDDCERNEGVWICKDCWEAMQADLAEQQAPAVDDTTTLSALLKKKLAALSGH